MFSINRYSHYPPNAVKTFKSTRACGKREAVFMIVVTTAERCTRLLQSRHRAGQVRSGKSRYTTLYRRVVITIKVDRQDLHDTHILAAARAVHPAGPLLACTYAYGSRMGPLCNDHLTKKRTFSRPALINVFRVGKIRTETNKCHEKQVVL